MENIFLKEEQVIIEAEKFLALKEIETKNDTVKYSSLLDEYKKLLKQFVTLVKVSDINQSELNALSKRLELTSNIDELTCLYNRRHFNEVYKREWENAVRSSSLLAVIMIDIDFFKRYNDIFGHLQGDTCLKAVSDAIRKAVLRPRDTVARFGGEEFVVLLPSEDVDGAVHVVKRITAVIKELDLENPGSLEYGKVSVSAGIAAAVPKTSQSSNELLDMADKALYQAKSEGRNCYRIYR